MEAGSLGVGQESGMQAFVGVVSGEVAREEILESLWKRKEWVLVLSFLLKCWH